MWRGSRNSTVTQVWVEMRYLGSHARRRKGCRQVGRGPCQRNECEVCRNRITLHSSQLLSVVLVVGSPQKGGRVRVAGGTAQPAQSNGTGGKTTWLGPPALHHFDGPLAPNLNLDCSRPGPQPLADSQTGLTRHVVLQDMSVRACVHFR